MIKRTVSFMVGKGSISHNRRKFTAKNVDVERTPDNVELCYTPIGRVYKELFSEALKRYNDKQTRADRKIKNYYEKIRTGHQEKPFHEIIVQIGNREDSGVGGAFAKTAEKILTEYYEGFQSRNPQLRVFNAVIHMDEDSPHLHLDFVPFTTGSKRGMDTRVSLKQALAMQGFIGKGKGSTEWAQWAESEKQELSIHMEAHGVEWEEKGTHERHLSVLDYKTKKREEELAELDIALEDKKKEKSMLVEQIENYTEGFESIKVLEEKLETPDYQLPEPTSLMTAKTYKTKFVEPLIAKLKKLLKEIVAKVYLIIGANHKLSRENDTLLKENGKLKLDNHKLKEHNSKLSKENRYYTLLERTIGTRGVEDLIDKANEIRQARHNKNKKLER